MKIKQLIASCTLASLGAINAIIPEKEVSVLVGSIVINFYLTQKRGYCADYNTRMMNIINLYSRLRAYRKEIKKAYPYFAEEIDELEAICQIIDRQQES